MELWNVETGNVLNYHKVELFNHYKNYAYIFLLKIIIGGGSNLKLHNVTIYITTNVFICINVKRVSNLFKVKYFNHFIF